MNSSLISDYWESHKLDDIVLSLPQKIVEQIPLLNVEEVQYIVIHYSDTAVSNSYTIQDFNEWHVQRGWKCCGYHYVVRPDGTIMIGRPIELQGAHCVADGMNKKSVGICYVGGRNSAGAIKDTRTYAQKISIAFLISYLVRRFPNIVAVLGHNDAASTWCPGFNAKAEYANIVSKLKTF